MNSQCDFFLPKFLDFVFMTVFYIMPQYAAPIAKAAQLFKLKGDLERMEALVSSIKWKPSGERTHIKTNPDSNKSFTRTNIITC
jgi:hypothetical protein